MPKIDRVWTRAEVLALPDDGNRYELIDGQLLVSPSPRPPHQLALYELYKLVAAYVDRHRLGIAGLAPADLDLRLGDVSQPDLFVVPFPENSVVSDWTEFDVPLLTVEVLSPSTARFDRTIKRRRYQEAGVENYWIVDLDGGIVEVWQPGLDHPIIADRVLTWQPRPELPALEIDLETFFRPDWRPA